MIMNKTNFILQALVEGLSEGSQRLTEATKAGEGTLPNTSPTGQTKIRQEIKSMNKDFEEFRTELMSAQEDLEECLTRWTQFEDGYLHFNNWLKETETYLRSELDFKANLEEKKRHWEQYQVILIIVNQL
jgi:nesprin-1